jgi:hypothetical protein
MSQQQIRKYPRTHHIEGSRLQPGDEDMDVVPFKALRGRHLVVEEKVDGANCGISFDAQGNLLLQSRGHYLLGGPRERHFDLFKQWAHSIADALRPILADRYVLYGEWLYAKHTIFYDRLPAYLLEFDILDTQRDEFLSTPRRCELLAPSPLFPVRILHEGPATSLKELTTLVGPSAFISGSHLETLRDLCLRRRLDPDTILAQTDPSRTMEGLYIKVEEDGVVKDRYKFIRPTFLTTVVQSDTHWLDRPIVPNQIVARATSP